MNDNEKQIKELLQPAYNAVPGMRVEKLEKMFNELLSEINRVNNEIAGHINTINARLEALERKHQERNKAEE